MANVIDRSTPIALLRVSNVDDHAYEFVECDNLQLRWSFDDDVHRVDSDPSSAVRVDE